MLARRAALAARGAIAARASPRPPFAAHAATARRAMRRSTSTYTVAAIKDGDDNKWRKLLSDADFLAAVEESDELAEAFVKRMDRQTVEISRLGTPEGEAPEIWTYAAHLFTHEDPAVLATARVAVWRDDGNAMIFQTAAASTAVPQEVLSRVVSTAKTEVENLASCDKVAGVARLDGSRSHCGKHGLCAWVRDTKAWERFEEPERSAVEAIATNTPRPGHSVLGKGTFEAAKEAWTTLALGFADRAEVGEAAIFRGAGAKLAGINWLHDTSPEALEGSGGATAAFHFESDS